MVAAAGLSGLAGHTRLTGWRWCVQSGVQAQSGDKGDGLTEGLAAVEQIQHGIAVVDQGAWGSQRRNCMTSAGPAGEFLGPCCW